MSARTAYVPLSVAWGEAFQFDWSEEGLVIGGVWRKVQRAHMKLCASRAFGLVGYPSQGHEMLFDAHTRCLTGLGGVAGRGIYDNMKTAVDRTPRKDRGRVVNARFAAMAAHYLIEAAGAQLRFPPPYSPDLNPIEQAFAKLKGSAPPGAATNLRSDLRALGAAIPRFTPTSAATSSGTVAIDSLQRHEKRSGDCHPGSARVRLA